MRSFGPRAVGSYPACSQSGVINLSVPMFMNLRSLWANLVKSMSWNWSHNPQFALKVISITGFGIHYDAVPGPGHQMTFGEAISTISRNGSLKILIPEWALWLTPRFRKTKVAFDELWGYMGELVKNYHENGSTSSQERRDLFSALLQANQEGNGSTEQLNKDELWGMFQ